MECNVASYGYIHNSVYPHWVLAVLCVHDLGVGRRHLVAKLKAAAYDTIVAGS